MRIPEPRHTSFNFSTNLSFLPLYSISISSSLSESLIFLICFCNSLNSLCHNLSKLIVLFRILPSRVPLRSSARPALTALRASATALRNLKTEVIEVVRSTERDDDQELCLKSQELIVGWLEIFFENKIFDEGLE